MHTLQNITVVLPSLDPDNKLLTVIDGLLEYGFTDIILINDGSKPENMHYFETAASHPEVHLLHHEVNKGKGAALKNAFRWFLENRPEGYGVVTVDGDNQHLYKPVRIGKVNAEGLIDEVSATSSAVKPDPYLSTYDWAKGL